MLLHLLFCKAVPKAFMGQKCEFPQLQKQHLCSECLEGCGQ